MLPYILFCIYLPVLTWLITRLPFTRDSGLSRPAIIILFLIKIAAGILIGWMSATYYPGNDYWGMNQEAQLEYDILISDPARFFSSLFHSPYAHYHGFFDSVGSYWNDLKNNLIIKVIALLNVISRGNYYVNSLFLNAFSFLGMMALYRVFIRIYPGKKNAVMIGCFLLPSTLYFSSGIYKDLVVLSLLGIYSYFLYQVSFGKASLSRWLMLILSCTGILLIRNYVAMVIIPFGIAVFICGKTSFPDWKTFSAVVLIGLLAVFFLPVLHPELNPLSVIVQKQKDFAALPVAHTQIPLQPLEPTPLRFIQNLPEAINHGFFRPYPWENKGRFLWPMAIEIWALPVLFVLFLLYRDPNQSIRHPFVLFGMMTAIILLIITGYIIPNLGSIIRYRSIYLPFLVTPLLACISYRKTIHII